MDKPLRWCALFENPDAPALLIFELVIVSGLLRICVPPFLFYALGAIGFDNADGFAFVADARRRVVGEHGYGGDWDRGIE